MVDVYVHSHIRSQSLMILALHSPILSSRHHHLVTNVFFFSMNILPTTISCGFLSMVSMENLENCLSFESERKCRVSQRQYLSYRNSPSMCISILMVKILSFLYNLQYGIHKPNSLGSRAFPFHLLRISNALQSNFIF